jgi:hypothetical protein
VRKTTAPTRSASGAAKSEDRSLVHRTAHQSDHQQQSKRNPHQELAQPCEHRREADTHEPKTADGDVARVDATAVGRGQQPAVAARGAVWNNVASRAAADRQTDDEDHRRATPEHRSAAIHVKPTSRADRRPVVSQPDG